MKRHVVWTDTARDDYFEIVSYIAARNPDAAERLASQIDRAANDLRRFATGRPGRVEGTFEKVVARLPYIIAYEATSLTDSIEVVIILHIIHGARKWPIREWPI